MTPLRSRIVITLATVALLIGVLWLGAQRGDSAPCVREGKLYTHGAFVRADTGPIVCQGGRWVAPPGAGQSP